MHYSKYPMLVLILAVFTSLSSTSLNAGAIHKWVDDKGSVHYSDTPPAKTSSMNVQVQSAPSDPGKALPRLKISSDTSDQAADGAGQEQKVSAEQASKICASAKADLDVISTSDRIKLQMADGSVRYLSDEEIAERQASSQTEVDRFCN
jgi:hypothetical protein